MSKLPREHKFLDLSDYGRPIAIIIANALKHTSFTPIHVTLGFTIAGLLAILFILNGQGVLAALFLVIKSILDAADGELARVKKTPSYSGRYLDSISDIILNFLLLLAIYFVTDGTLWMTGIAFIGIQLQGTLYNYYYVILRNYHNGDTTSRVFEDEIPVAMKGEKQSNVTLLFKVYTLLYGVFDRTIYYLDKKAVDSHHFPKWFMTMVSTFGLGFQLLIIGVMYMVGLKGSIMPFFMIYSLFIFVFIGIRRMLNPG